MKLFPLTLIAFWIILIVFPEIIAYLIGWFFIVVGINMLAITSFFGKKKDQNGDYIKFGSYKIYK